MVRRWWACRRENRNVGRRMKCSFFKWLVNGGVGVQAGGVGVHELGGVMGCHGGHAAGVSCVGDAGHDSHNFGYLLL